MENSEKSPNLIIPKKEMLELSIISILVSIFPVADILISDLEESFFQFEFNFRTFKYIADRISFFIISFLIPIIFAFALNLFSGNKLFQNQKRKLIFQIIIGIIYIIYFTFFSPVSMFCIALTNDSGGILEEIILLTYFVTILALPVYLSGKLQIFQKGKLKIFQEIVKRIIFILYVYFIFLQLFKIIY